MITKKSGLDIQLVSENEAWYSRDYYEKVSNVCSIYSSTDICYTFRNDETRSPCSQDHGSTDHTAWSRLGTPEHYRDRVNVTVSG